MNDSAIPEEIPVSWPLGPLYYEMQGADRMDSTRSWVNYKLSAARWYISTLKKAIDIGGFHRTIGVEMALDGASSSLNGAFDSAVRGLGSAAEQYLKKDEENPTYTVPRKIDFRKCMTKLARQELEMDVRGIAVAVESAVEVGLDKDNPKGWLEQFRRFRNTPMHENTAPRHIEVVVGTDAVTSLRIGNRAVNPVAYLEHTEQKIAALIFPMLDLIDDILPNGLPSPRPLLRATTP